MCLFIRTNYWILIHELIMLLWILDDLLHFGCNKKLLLIIKATCILEGFVGYFLFFFSFGLWLFCYFKNSIELGIIGYDILSHGKISHILGKKIMPVGHFLLKNNSRCFLLKTHPVTLGMNWGSWTFSLCCQGVQLRWFTYKIQKPKGGKNFSQQIIMHNLVPTLITNQAIPDSYV